MKKINLFKNKLFKNYVIIVISLFLIEILFRVLLNLEILKWPLLRIFIGVNIISLIITMLFNLFPEKIVRILNIIFVFIVEIYAITQLGFSNFMGTFISINSSSQLGKVTSYIKDYLSTFSWAYFLIFIPFILLILYYLFLNKKVDKKIVNKNKCNYLLFIFSLIIFINCFYLTLIIPAMQNKYQVVSNKELFLTSEVPNTIVNEFGITPYAIIDFKTLAFKYDKTVNITDASDNNEEEPSDSSRIVDSASWQEIINNETNETYQELNNYFINRTITSKNDKTGIFKDKNLIVILLESVNDIPYHYPEYFPNLNKLYNEGWSWVNNFTPRNSCSTGNNEMTVMTSLFTINNSCTANYYKSNTYYESVFGIFNEANYYTSSYHDYSDAYYSRKIIHKNMGSQKFLTGNGLNVKLNDLYEEWPSDRLLFENSYSYYIDKDKFMTFYTTVTTHRPYTVASEFGDKYLDKFKDLKLSTASKRYLSKMYELDLAIGDLLKILEENGELDNTVIALFGDHYPYGLSNKQLQEFYEYDITENYERDRIPFIIYNSTIIPEKYEAYSTIMNILPTLANLFDLEYDPRLYMGNDLFDSNYESLAIFTDGSWKNEYGFYSATKSKFFSNGIGDISSEKIISLNTMINNKIKMSNLAIKKNYFSYLEKNLAKYQKQDNIEKATTES